MSLYGTERRWNFGKSIFVKIFEQTLISANLDITGLHLIDDDAVLIEFKGGCKRRVNIEGDSFGAIITDVMKHVH